jgi:hypothetical protein
MASVYTGGFCAGSYQVGPSPVIVFEVLIQNTEFAFLRPSSTMNRPRPSVLQLFDPLSTRDVHSPDSDKENSLPDDFFLQIHVKHPSPVRLTRRLVEVGDITVDDRADHSDSDGEGGDEEEDEDDTIGPYPAPTPRTPLGEVTFDREVTPMRSKMYRRKANISPRVTSNPAPDDYAFASVINAVNASAFHAPPSVVISSPDESPSSSNGDSDILSTSIATLSLATPTGSLIADTTLAFPTPSEASTSLLPIAQPPSSMTSCSEDYSSTDPHSSFALHMDTNPAETSFDLLNDKISFLGHSDEESYYMEGGLVSILEEEDVTEAGGFLLIYRESRDLMYFMAGAGFPSPLGSSTRAKPTLLIAAVESAAEETVRMASSGCRLGSRSTLEQPLEIPQDSLGLLHSICSSERRLTVFA